MTENLHLIISKADHSNSLFGNQSGINAFLMSAIMPHAHKTSVQITMVHTVGKI